MTDNMTTEPMHHEFNEGQIAEFKEAFSVFDKDSDGLIDNKELSFVMRALGQNYSEIELQDMVHKVDESTKPSDESSTKNTDIKKGGVNTKGNTKGNNKGTIDFSKFLNILAYCTFEKVDERESLRNAFKMFDDEKKGFISVSKLHDLMTNLGDKLTEQEVDEMIREAKPNEDKHVKYDDFIERMLERVC